MSDFSLSPYLPVAELRARHEALKQAVLGRIMDHFLRRPAPVRKIDVSRGANGPEYVQLLDYHVPTSEENEAYIMELGPDDFGYENRDDEPARDSYGVLSVGVLIDLVLVLEHAAGGGAEGAAETTVPGAE